MAKKAAGAAGKKKQSVGKSGTSKKAAQKAGAKGGKANELKSKSGRATKSQKRVAKKVETSRKKVTKKAATRRSTGKRVTKTGAKGPQEAPVAYKVKIGDHAPAFSALATSGKTLSLAGFSGRPFVLYFYPKDNTPGCTLEGQDFKRLNEEFAKLGCAIVGVSRDSMKSHEGFKAKCGFPFELLADESGEVCGAFDVIQMKSLYGRKFEGIERSTFVVDGAGVVRGAWRKVKVNGHAEEVLSLVRGL